MNVESNGTRSAVRIRRKVYVDTDEGMRLLVVTFHGLPDGKQHVAWVYGDLQAPVAALPLVRVHSECHTGDLWQSLLCDCGPQLKEARRRCREEGRGVVLYMEEEGRGIGLYEKIEAYHLQQERGLNTYEANEGLGHPADSRDFTVAAQMIKALGLTAIRLLTNNPNKVEALQGEGITVEQVTTATYDTEQNRKYLEDKKKITNHRLSLGDN
jgi:GTP cyclohydrolase II